MGGDLKVEKWECLACSGSGRVMVKPGADVWTVSQAINEGHDRAYGDVCERPDIRVVVEGEAGGDTDEP